MDYINSEMIRAMTNKYPYSLYITDSKGNKVAHDAFNYGNFLWGAGMRSLTIPYHHAVIGAHIDNMRNNNGEFDSADDQFSIFMGYMYKRR